jgi:tetratricopeptide (TPR) repeat protein
MASMSEPFTFKFHRVDAAGRQATTFRKKGSIDDQQLVLDKEIIPVSSLRAATSRLDRLILVVDSKGGAVSRVFLVNKKALRQVVPAINVRISAGDCAKRAEALAKAGRAHEFRLEVCPGCLCSIDLSRHPRSPEVYCPYCDTIWAVPETDPQRRREEPAYRRCDSCGLYSKPSSFTSGYIIFLFVAVMYKFHTREICNACMRGEAWKMVATNLLGLIGEIAAVPNLIRAYAGGSARSQVFSGLDSGNALVQGRKFDRALTAYDTILARLRHCAGVRYNYGLALMRADRHEQAGLMLAQALQDCANYAPAADALGACYKRLGMTDELESLKREWNDEPNQPTESDVAHAAT